VELFELTNNYRKVKKKEGQTIAFWT